MHLLKLSILIVVLSFLFTCEKNAAELKATACDEAILAHLQLEPFTGQIDDLDCKFHLDKYLSPSGEELYSPDCNCCDMALVVYGCEGEIVCNAFELCPLFSELTFVRTVGVEAE